MSGDKFTVHDPASEAGKVFEELLQHAKPRFEYDELIDQLAKVEVGKILQFQYGPASMTNFNAILKVRGLVKNVDYSAKGQTLPNGDYWVVMKKLTDKKGKKMNELKAERDDKS